MFEKCEVFVWHYFHTRLLADFKEIGDVCTQAISIQKLIQFSNIQTNIKVPSDFKR